MYPVLIAIVQDTQTSLALKVLREERFHRSQKACTKLAKHRGVGIQRGRSGTGINSLCVKPSAAILVTSNTSTALTFSPQVIYLLNFYCFFQPNPTLSTESWISFSSILCKCNLNCPPTVTWLFWQKEKDIFPIFLEMDSISTTVKKRISAHQRSYRAALRISECKLFWSDLKYLLLTTEKSWQFNPLKKQGISSYPRCRGEKRTTLSVIAWQSLYLASNYIIALFYIYCIKSPLFWTLMITNAKI